MPDFFDLLGTSENSFSIGDRSSGTKSLIIDNGFQSSVNWNPTQARVLSFPNKSGILEAKVNYTVSDANFTIPVDADVVDQIGTMTAARTFTLPAIASVPIGRAIVVRQLGQSYGGLIPLSVAPASGNLLNYSNTSLRFPFLIRELVFVATSVGWFCDLPSGLRLSQDLIYAERIFSAATLAGLVAPNDHYLGANTNGAGTFVAMVNNGRGVLSIGAGTTATGGASYQTAANSISSSGLSPVFFYTRFYVPNLSDATNSYTISLGVSNTNLIATPADNAIAGFKYSHSIFGGNFSICNFASGVDSGISVATNTWIDVGLLLSDQSYFVVNGSLVFTGSRNNSVGSQSIGMGIRKTAGTTNRDLRVRVHAIAHPPDWTGL